MTFQNMLDRLKNRTISLETVSKELITNERLKQINYFANIFKIKNEALNEEELQELEAIVNILQILYNSKIGSPIKDSIYDELQETLVSMGIPRLTGTVELNSLNKKHHHFTQLRGTLDKIYYIYPDEERTNPSRKYLDEWINSNQLILKQKGIDIDLKNEDVILLPKFDGVSAENESDANHSLWLLRGDTSMNLASDVSHILAPFDKQFRSVKLTGTKTEVVMTLEKKDQLCKLLNQSYTSSCRLVGAILNSTQPDFRVDFLTVVPLRIIREGNDIEQIHPDLIRNFPTEVCKLNEYNKIKEYAEKVRNLEVNGEHYPTDGVVIVFINPLVKRALGRINNINRFEVAYKYLGEEAYAKVQDIEFYVSQFARITPVVVTETVEMKGRKVNHISISNKERFDELNLHYGDEVKIHYEIIPYVTIDEKCLRDSRKKKIEFPTKCPACGAQLDLNNIEVQCTNPDCICRRIGRILNYCEGTRIKNIGYQTLYQLYNEGLLSNGIISLYKLKKYSRDISLLPRFGPIYTKKIISEIESHRRLPDYLFFGSLGIEGISHTIFKAIFKSIPHNEFISLIFDKNFNELRLELLKVPGIAEAKSNIIIEWFKIKDNREELKKLLKEINIYSEDNKNTRGRIVFTGCRPSDFVRAYLKKLNYEVSDNWNKDTIILVVKNDNYTSDKVNKAKAKNIPIITYDKVMTDIK